MFRHFMFLQAYQEPLKPPKKARKSLFWPHKTYAFSPSKSYLEAIENTSTRPLESDLERKVLKKGLKSALIFLDFHL